MNLQRVQTILLGKVLLLPLAILIVLGAGQLLAVMGDQHGQLWFRRLAMLGGCVWILDVVALLALLAALSLGCCRENK